MNLKIVSAIVLIVYISIPPATCQKVKILEEEFIFNEAPFPSCHASTIAEIPGGIIAAWFGGLHEKNPDVEIYISKKQNGKWSEPQSVANGIQHKNLRYPCWNPVLFRYPNGPLMLFYKVGKNPREWWGEVKTSFDNGATWSDAKRLPEEILGPIKNKPVLLKDGRLICPSSTEHDGWKVHFEITSDTTKSWEKIGPINGASKLQIIQPSILEYADGRMQILCRSQDRYVVESWSNDNGNTWSEPTKTTLPNPGSGIDALTLRNGFQVIIYNHNSEDLNKKGGTNRSPLNLAISQDGKNWKMIHTFENTEGEYSYPAIIQDQEGNIHATYTYHREKIKYVKLRLEE